MIIRSWQPEDAEGIARAINNKKVQDNLRDGIPFPYTIDDARAYLNTVLGSPLAFAVTHNDSVIGSIALQRSSNIHRRTAELGYYIAEPFWGKGIATQAVGEICRIAFETTDLLRIFATPFSDNPASCRVLEKTGFIREGTMRSNAFKNGAVRDMELYALVREES